MNVKTVIKKLGRITIAMAIMLATVNVNTCCWFAAYQPELPKNAEKLSKIKR